MSQPICGTITSFRVGIRTQMPKWCLVRFGDAGSVSKSGQFIGRKVVWTQGKKKLIGEIISLHGKKGVVTVKFRKGVPGWAIGTTVELMG